MVIATPHWLINATKTWRKLFGFGGFISPESQYSAKGLVHCKFDPVYEQGNKMIKEVMEQRSGSGMAQAIGVARIFVRGAQTINRMP